MTTILDTLKNTADEEKAATALAAFARENPEALETIIKANQLFLEKFAPSGGENLYNAYRETARAYKKKNLIQSNYPYDSQNYAEAAAYYLKAAETAPDAGRKLSSLDGAASMSWNLDDKKQWCRVKLQQVPSVSDKDKTRLYMDIARETADKKQQKELYAKALAYAAQMSGDDDVRAETVNRLKKLTE